MPAAATLSPTQESVSIFQGDLPLETKLEKARTELLDLSARNRLLNMPRSAKSAKTLEIIDERGAEVFRLLVKEARSFTFLPGKGQIVEDEDGDEAIAELALPEDDGVNAQGVANRHADTRLQTRLTAAGLQKRLLELYHDARTLEEEQGVNILFLAIGSLRWIDPNNPALARYAPLILVPVSLERGNAAEKFKLRMRPEDVADNLSLEAYLDRLHGLKLPTFDAGDDFSLSAYISAVAEAVSSKLGWSVAEDDIVLGFFSFAKFLMYRDLDPLNWPPSSRLSEHALIRPLVSDGFAEGAPLLPEDSSVDAHVAAGDTVHIVDSDSSQTLAIEEVRRGHNLVIQGPPGTGKSQTIANIIASAVAGGKKVLFVAEKMAALEVVKRRLDAAGVGAACLELHSNKANKRAVLEELRRTWELGAPRADNLDALNARLTDARDRLNQHAQQLHTPRGHAELTPFEVIGHLVRLRQQGVAPARLRLEGAAEWTRAEFENRSRLVAELAERLEDLGEPRQHLWRGVDIERLLPPDISRLTDRLRGLCDRLAALRTDHQRLAAVLEVDVPPTLVAFEPLRDLVARLAMAPDLEPLALASQAWTRLPAIQALLRDGIDHAALRRGAVATFSDAGWTIDVESLLQPLRPLPASTPAAAFGHARRAGKQLPELLERGGRLAAAVGRNTSPITLGELARLVEIGGRIATAPDADPSAFAQDLWDTGVERAADLAAAVAALEEARAAIGSALHEAAWSMNLMKARQALAAHGTSFFRILSDEWRAAERLVRSVLTDTKAPLNRRLAWLDALAKGQAALKRIRDDDDTGRSAFGADWRGDRSPSAPLLALVEWMRSLRGLGAEPRIVASRRPDRSRIDGLARGLATRLADVKVELVALFEVAQASPALFGNAADLDDADVTLVHAACSTLAAVHDRYVNIGGDPAFTVGACRAALESLAHGQQIAARLRTGENLGREAFGAAWKAAASDWPVLRRVADWVQAHHDIRQLASRIGDRAALQVQSDAVKAAGEQWCVDVRALLAELKAGPEAAITADGLVVSEVTVVAEQLAAWRDGGETLATWVAYRARAHAARGLGLQDLVERLHDGRLAPRAARADFEQAFFETVLAVQVDADPNIATFDGELHGRRVRDFVDLDRQRIRAAASQVAREHHKRVPSRTGAGVGPLGVLKGEMAKKKNFLPIRQLMARAAPAVQAIKPVFMMSPLSVAQFLPPGALAFDLLVMDEASQIQPVDALGAIARARQIVVVGDQAQLPPTAFFNKVISSDADDDAGPAAANEVESILGLCEARGLPSRMLRWHYRSRHESLIAVSNNQFYKDKLIIVPSPFTAQSGLGLRFHHVKDGVFETGTTRTNPVEAVAVARAVIHHARTAPDQSLGVVAFSVAQRKAIVEQLEVMRRGLPPAEEAFFQSHPTEPFFVKNLENVQGDERDVILISIGYGPTSPGARPPMRFGPVGQDGGERRLNVLISRAKRKCEVFASMTDEDIDPEFAVTRKGVYALKLFMHFARTGRLALAASAGHDRHSVFEDQVAQALHERGYQVHRDVGVSGLFIDITVADLEHPDRYLLAIECDGPSYRDARSARDRDRLRQSVLQSQGWIVHRVWSGDWFKRPNEQLERVVAAIEAAKVELARDTLAAGRLPAYEGVSVKREQVAEMGLQGVVEDGTPIAAPYVEVVLTRPSHAMDDLHAVPTGVLSQLAEQVVACEGPVHFDEIVARLRDAWGHGRAGERIRDAVRRAVETSARQGRIIGDANFYVGPGAAIVVRDRSAASSPTLRRAECLPPAEIEMALVDVVSRNFGATDDQAIQAVSRAMGFKATSAQIRDAIASVLARSLDKGLLVRRDALVDVGPNAPKPARSPVRQDLTQLIAAGEGESLEFKETLRWDLRQSSVNRRIEDASLKAIVAFANHRGGTLLVGVDDDGTIKGIGPDLATFAGSRDRFELHLTNLIKDRFSESFRAGCVTVSYPMVDDKLVCRIDVKRSRRPVYLSVSDGSGPAAERLIVRAGASSPEIPLSQVAAYVHEHFDALPQQTAQRSTP